MSLHYLEKHEPRKLSFQSCWPTTQEAFRSDIALLRIARHTVAIVLQVDWRRYSEHFFVREEDEVDCRQHVPKECRYRDTVYSMTEKTQFLGFMFLPVSAETLVRRSGIK